MKNWRVMSVAVLLITALAAGFFLGKDTRRPPPITDVIVVRTPGGLLEVATLEKRELLAWNIAWVCPLNLCKFLPTANSQISAQVRYTYRIPLAKHWVLEKISDAPLRYRLQLPKLEPQLPVTVNLTTIRLLHNGGVFAPAGLAQQTMQGYLQPDLDKRAVSEAYVNTVRAEAAKTVIEFAKKWMRDGNIKINDNSEIEVVF